MLELLPSMASIIYHLTGYLTQACFKMVTAFPLGKFHYCPGEKEEMQGYFNTGREPNLTAGNGNPFGLLLSSSNIKHFHRCTPKRKKNHNEPNMRKETHRSYKQVIIPRPQKLQQVHLQNKTFGDLQNIRCWEFEAYYNSNVPTISTLLF